MIQRRKPLRRLTPLKRGSFIKRISAKRRRESAIYSGKRQRFLTARPQCEICLKEWEEGANRKVQASRDVHHVKGRLGGNYLNESTWMAVCREHHHLIHERPGEARAKGWLQ